MAEDYIVQPGDTLSEIARDFGVSVSDIRRWNDLDGDLIRIGQELDIRSSGRGSSRGDTEFIYLVEQGDTLSRIASRHDVSVDDLVRWNRGIDRDLIRVNQEIRIYLDDEPGRSSSVGQPQRGRLSLSEQLEDGAGYWVRNSSRAYGTNETTTLITEVFGRIHQRYPDAPEIVIGDISYRRGGRMRPHQSHQTGRDVDLAYYTFGREDDNGFIVATPENLDVPMTWHLLNSFLETGEVRYIFVDYELQEVLYDYVHQRGASGEELAEWFQYPREEYVGIIRHSSGHDDHIHIRLDCPSSDSRCDD